MTTSGQITVLAAYSALIGILIGMIYDVFRILRAATPDIIKGTRAETVIVFFEDILFWLIASVVFIIFIYYANKGHTRLIMIADAALGFLAYYFTLGRLVMLCSGYIIKAVRYFLKLLRKIFINPLIFVLTGVIIIFGKKYRAFSDKKTLKKAEKLALKGYRL